MASELILYSASPLSARKDVPHIWFFQGYWRVSRWPRGRDPFSLQLWIKANDFATRLNGGRRENPPLNVCRI